MDYHRDSTARLELWTRADSGYGTGENSETLRETYTADAAFAGYASHDRLALAHQQPRGPDYVRHYLINHVIEPTAEGVKGKEYRS
jgi:hypothetical protein